MTYLMLLVPQVGSDSSGQYGWPQRKAQVLPSAHWTRQDQHYPLILPPDRFDTTMMHDEPCLQSRKKAPTSTNKSLEWWYLLPYVFTFQCLNAFAMIYISMIFVACRALRSMYILIVNACAARFHGAFCYGWKLACKLFLRNQLASNSICFEH